MKKSEIKVGGVYQAKVSDRIVDVRIDSTHTQGGWNATNTATGKRIRIKSAQRLRGPAEGGKKNAKATREPKAEDQAEPATEAPATKKAAKEPKPKTESHTVKKSGVQKANRDLKPKRVSALDAAAQVLEVTGKPMRARELITAMAEQGLWSSPAGKTPHATLYAAMQREERDKGDGSRFKKVDRGLFEYHTPKSV
jgi:hypothetical protein